MSIDEFRGRLQAVNDGIDGLLDALDRIEWGDDPRRDEQSAVGVRPMAADAHFEDILRLLSVSDGEAVGV